MIAKRWTRAIVGAVLLGTAGTSAAQEDPPPGAADDVDPPDPDGADAEDWAEEPLPSEELSEEESPFPLEEEDEVRPDNDTTARERRLSLAESTSTMGATGLMRVLSASSGGAGTFRFSLLTGFYSGSGFLCPQCPSNGEGAGLRDQVDRVSGNFFLSATPVSFLEAYAGIFSHSTSTDRPVPQLKQVVGDWSLGVKAFMPPEEGQIFSVGGAMDLGFSTGSGQVGLSGIDSVNLGLRALATADLSRRTSGPIPLRAHLNLGYQFDNSGKLVEDFERTQERPIDRIERFALDINRVDFMQIGLGVEGLFDTARPFLEWSVDIPANRQSYLCLRALRYSGDSCLRDRPVFSTTPSRISAGVRLMPWSAIPWWLEGMTVTGALDLATGGAADFLVEVAPEVPWTIWFGIGYAADTKPQVQIQQIAMPAPEPAAPQELFVHGMVIEKETSTAIPEALIRFEGRDLTGMISTAEGRFVTSSLEPGRYTFKITAPGYKDGSCSVEVGKATAPAAEPPLENEPAPGTTGWKRHAREPERGLGSTPDEEPARAGASTVTCELEPVAKVSNINGRVNDSTNGSPIGMAKVRITDVLGRGLELDVDEVGAFRFENVPPGATTISVDAPGYLKSVTRLSVEPLQELDQRITLAPAPAKSTFKVAGKRIESASPIDFAEGTAKPSRDAMFTIQELAVFLADRPEIARIEIQSHTGGGDPGGLNLSTERANAVRDALILHGVAAARLTARGFGASEPLMPAGSEEARRKNERVVLSIQAQ